VLGKKILVVDDEDHIRRVVEFKLSAAGYRVSTAPDAESALVAAKLDRPDLLITDLQMPGASGLDLCRSLESETPAGAPVPALLLTARNHELRDTSAHPSNLKRVISKPFSPRNLVQVVRETLGEAV